MPFSGITNRLFKKLDMKYLIMRGVYVGHSEKNSTHYAKWTVFGKRQGITLINIRKTLIGLRTSLHGAWGYGRSRVPVWFVNLYWPFAAYTQSAAYNCGEFFATKFWIIGLVSNYKHMHLNALRLYKIPGMAYRAKESRHFEHFKNWYFTRFSWPRCLFVGSIFWSHLVTKECTNGGVGCVGIADTNSSAWFTNFAIAANDDSLESVVFFYDIFSLYILIGKFRLILRWYNGVRKMNRFKMLYRWLPEDQVKKAFESKNSKIRNYFDLYTKVDVHHPSRNLKLFISSNYLFSRIVEDSRVYYKNLFSTDKSFWKTINYSSYIDIMLNLSKTFWYKLLRKKYFYRRGLSNDYFRNMFYKISLGSRKFTRSYYLRHMVVLGSKKMVTFLTYNYKLFNLLRAFNSKAEEVWFSNISCRTNSYFSVISRYFFKPKIRDMGHTSREDVYATFSFLSIKFFRWRRRVKRILSSGNEFYSVYYKNYYPFKTKNLRKYWFLINFGENSLRFSRTELILFNRMFERKAVFKNIKKFFFLYSNFFASVKSHRFKFEVDYSFYYKVRSIFAYRFRRMYKNFFVGFLSFANIKFDFTWLKDSSFSPDMHYILPYRILWSRLFRFCTLYNSLFVERRFSSFLQHKIRKTRFFSYIYKKKKYRKKKKLFVLRRRWHLSKEIKRFYAPKKLYMPFIDKSLYNFPERKCFALAFHQANKLYFKRFKFRYYVLEQFLDSRISYDNITREYNLLSFFWEIPNSLYVKRRKSRWYTA